MQTAQITEHTANQLNTIAEREQVTTSDLIERLIKKYIEEKQPELLTDFAGILADSPSFQGDPLEVQKAMRDEWN